MENRNLSLKGESLNLNAGRNYYIIDSLYLNSIKVEIDKLDKGNIDQEIEEKVLPFTIAPFAKIRAIANFRVEKIKKSDYKDVDSDAKNYFFTDTGLIVLIAEELLLDIVNSFDYNVLVDASSENVINYEHWDNITSNYSRKDIGLLLAPGINSGLDFQGSGIYKIVV